MENITIKDIVEITNGVLLCGDENKIIKEFSIDSRSGNEESIFVPMIGEKVDAHRFIESALQINGATFTQEHDQAQGDKPWIRVEDTLEAMQKVGTYYRNQLDLPVVAVTGSVGKTTTREMIATALRTQKRVYETQGNQNSQVGVPLTLSHMDRADEVAVLEIGMSERGQIEKLTKMIRPNIAVVTVIGVSHIAQLKTQENICIEKMDVVKGLPEDGKIFLNGDDPFLKEYRGKLPFETYFYGMSEECEYRADNVVMHDGKTSFRFHYAGKSVEVILGTMGEHNVRNALVALGIAHQMGVDVEAAAKELSVFQGQRQQMLEGQYCRLIDDTYNASPDSMKAAIKVLATMQGVVGCRIAVLADMLELGEKEKEYHYEVGSFLAEYNLDAVFTYGELSKEIISGISDHNDKIIIMNFSTKEELTEYLLSYVQKDDMVLLKGSNGMKLKEVSKVLQGENA